MDRRAIPIFIAVFTNILGAGVILPILPLYAEGQFGATAFQATLLASFFFAAQFLAAPVLGRLSDRFGRRPPLILSQIGTVIAFIIFILAPSVGKSLDGVGATLGISGGLLVLYFARILDGLTGGNISIAQAYIADISTEETRTQAYGLLSAAFGLGFIFGPAFGGILSGVNLLAPFIGAAIITSVSVVVTMVMLPESVQVDSGRDTPNYAQLRSQWLSNHTILLILIVGFTLVLAFSALQSTFALYGDRVLFPDLLDNLVARNIGLMFAVVGIVNVITQLALIRPLVKRFGEQRLVVLGQFSLFLGLLGTGLFTNPWIVTLLLIPVAFGQGLNQPSLQALITRFGTTQTRGQLLGLAQSVNSLGFILGPLWAGYVFERLSPSATYLLGAGLVMISLILALVLAQREIAP